MIMTHPLTIHLDRRGEPPTADVVQGDTGRALALSLLAQSAAWEPPEGTQAAIRFRKSDGTGGCYDTMPDGTSAYSISGSTVTIYLAPQVTTAPGIAELQVVLRCEDTELATFTALLRVQADPSLDTLESENYVNLSGWIQAEMDRRWENVFNSDGYINSKVDALHLRQDAQFTAGMLSMTDGSEADSALHIRSGFLVHGGREITVVIPEGIKALIFFYDENYSFVGRSAYFYETFSTYLSAPYARCVAAYADDAEVTDPEILANKVALFYRGDTHDAFRGSIRALGYAYFDQCLQDGYYSFSAEDAASIGDAPDISCGGILEVLPYSGDGIRLQLLRTNDGEVWFRSQNGQFQRILPQASGTNGATFTPFVNQQGDLSWSNDKGLTNPATVNIMGPQGIQGEPGATPVKGSDYFTDEDRLSMMEELKAALPAETWTFTLEDGTTIDKQVVILS